MATLETGPTVFGPGAKLVGVLVIVAAAFATGFSAGSHRSAGEMDRRLDELNQSLYQRMLSHAAAWGEPAQPPTARTGGEQVSAADGEAELAPSGGN